MKMVKIISAVSLLVVTQANFAEENKAGAELYKQNCSVCHGSTGGMDMQKRIAPPIAAVRMHYISTYSDKDSFVQAVSGWVEKQDESKSMMRGAIRRFKIMPPISIAKTDAEKIAAYIYDGDIDKPEGFEDHVKEEHGNQKGEMQGMKHEGMDHDNMNHEDMKHKAGMK
jgi:hypothetical protein